MGKTVINEDKFPEIVDLYNNYGKAAAYDHMKSIYGIKNAGYVINRIKKSDTYTYDPEKDRFLQTEKPTTESVFMSLDDLCETSLEKAAPPLNAITDPRPAAMEKLVHELISDRLLTLSRYIIMDSSTRSILIDQTSLSADGYKVVTH